MRRTSSFLISLILLFQTGCCALSLSSGYYSDNTRESSILRLDHDIENDNYAVGISLNGNLSPNDYGLETAVLRYFEYDDGTLGIRYAPIEGMTFGYGLLLNDLNTTFYQPAFSRNETNGLRVSYDTSDFLVESFGTYSHLYGIQVRDISIFNLNVGFEYISDTKKELQDDFGRALTGAYVELPLTSTFSLFAEGASASNGGSGSLAGASFDYDLIFAFTTIKAAAVSFDDKFIPSYFTSGYDIDPIDISSFESENNNRYGSMASLDMGIMGLIDLRYSNEQYTDGGSANSGYLYLNPLKGFDISGFVKELSFRDYRLLKGSGAVLLGGKMNYQFSKEWAASLNYRKNSTGDGTDPYSTTYGSVNYSF